MTTASFRLQTRLLVRLGLSAGIVLALMALAALGLARRAHDAALAEALDARAGALLTLLAEMPSGQAELPFDDALATEYGPESRRAFFAIREPGTGRELERSENLTGIAVRFPALAESLSPGGAYAWDDRVGGTPVRWLARRAPAAAPGGDEDEPAAETGRAAARSQWVACVAVDRSGLDRQFAALALVTLAVAGGGYGLLLLAGWWTVSRGLQPLTELVAAVGRLDPAQPAAVPVPPVEEIARVSVALNGLLAAVRESMARERRFTADVAHELRTPVAEIRTAAEVALLEGARLTVAERQRCEDFRDAALELERTIVALLTAARAEAGTLTARREPVDLAALSAGLWERLAARVRAKQLTVVQPPVGITLATDPDLCRVLLGNLFANAVQHAPVGSSVNWTMAVDATGFRLAVSNPAPVLTAADVPRLFERHWCKPIDQSDAPVSCGLGLALVRRVAELLGYSVQADLDRDHRLTVTLAGPTG